MHSEGLVAAVVRTTTVVLLAPLLWRGALAAAAAFELRSAAVVANYLLIAVLLIGSGSCLDVSARRFGYAASPFGVVLLLATGAFALAIGSAPGLLCSSLAATFTVVLAGGPAASAVPRIATIVFASSVGAAWQLGMAPAVAMVLIRS